MEALAPRSSKRATILVTLVGVWAANAGDRLWASATELPDACAANGDGGSCDEASSLLQTRRAAAEAALEVEELGGGPSDGGGPIKPPDDIPGEIKKLADRLALEPSWNPRLLPHTYIESDMPFECKLDDGEEQPVLCRNILPQKLYNIYPGKDAGTSCLNSSSPFYFQFRKGSGTDGKNKLLIYFQGGGACWDQTSYKAGGCLTETTPQPWAGILDHKDTANAYQNFSKLHILYCSGDMHIGNVTQDWPEPVEQRGFNNAISAVDWAADFFGSSLSHLTIAGCSAGSLGSQIWSNYLIDRFTKTGQMEVNLLADSFVGAFHPLDKNRELQGNLMKTFAAVDLPLWPEEIAARWQADNMTLSEFLVYTMRTYPEARFTMINSKEDETQIYFERMFSATVGNWAGFRMTPEEYYKDINLILQQYEKGWTTSGCTL